MLSAVGGITSLIFPFKNSENLFKIYFSALEHFFILGEKPNSKKFSELLNNIIIDYTGTKLFPLRRMPPPTHPPLHYPSSFPHPRTRRAPAGGRPGRIRPARPTRTARRGAGRAWVPARRSVGRGRQSGPKVETDQNGVGACRAAWLGGHGARGRVGGARPARCPQERRMGAAKVWLIVHVNLVHVNFVLRLLSGHPPADTTPWSWPGSSG